MHVAAVCLSRQSGKADQKDPCRSARRELGIRGSLNGDTVVTLDTLVKTARAISCSRMEQKSPQFVDDPNSNERLWDEFGTGIALSNRTIKTALSNETSYCFPVTECLHSSHRHSDDAIHPMHESADDYSVTPLLLFYGSACDMCNQQINEQIVDGFAAGNSDEQAAVWKWLNLRFHNYVRTQLYFLTGEQKETETHDILTETWVHMFVKAQEKTLQFQSEAALYNYAKQKIDWLVVDLHRKIIRNNTLIPVSLDEDDISINSAVATSQTTTAAYALEWRESLAFNIEILLKLREKLEARKPRPKETIETINAILDWVLHCLREATNVPQENDIFVLIANCDPDQVALEKSDMYDFLQQSLMIGRTTLHVRICRIGKLIHALEWRQDLAFDIKKLLKLRGIEARKSRPKETIETINAILDWVLHCLRKATNVPQGNDIFVLIEECDPDQVDFNKSDMYDFLQERLMIDKETLDVRICRIKGLIGNTKVIKNF